MTAGVSWPREDEVVRSSDGRRLGVAQYGDPEGFPVLLFHGTPGSRLWFSPADPVGTGMGARLVAIDRPGYGLSAPWPARDAASGAAYALWPGLVAELSEGLGLDRFAILSVSGGGPYAAACAARLPAARLARVSIVAGPAPPGTYRASGRMARSNRIGLRLARVFGRARWLGRLITRPSVRYLRERPDEWFDRMARELCPSDAEISARPEFRAQVRRELLEGYRQGVDALIDESARLVEPWQIPLEDIRVPVDIWHGVEDTLAPIEMGRALAAAIPGAALHEIEGRGHFLLDDPELWERILRATMAEPDG